MTTKSRRLLLIVAAALLLLISATAFFINLYRDSIALGVARSALGDSGIEVTDVSVDSISSTEVLFDAIVLELAGGGSVFIDGITLPVRFRGLRDSRLHIDSVRYVPATEDTGPVRLAAALQVFLDAPDATPGATIEIDRVSLPLVPDLLDLAWHADTLNPTLRATVADFEIFVTTTEIPDGLHKGSIRALLPDDSEAFMAGLLLAPDASGFRVEGTLSALLEPLLPALHAVGAVPAEVKSIDAAVSGTFEFALPADETLPVEIDAVLEAAPGTNITYDAEGSMIGVSVIESAAVSAALEYPSFEWSARVAQASLSVTGPLPGLPPVRLRDSECRAGIHCRTALELSFDKLVFGELSIDRADIAAAAVQFDSRGDQWDVSAPGTRFNLKRPAFGGHRVIAPTILADLAGTNDRVSASIRFNTPEGGLAGSADLSHDLSRDRGELALQNAAIDFAKLGLPDIFSDWPHDWSIEAGRAAAEAKVRWKKTAADFVYEGTAAVTADALAGRYADIGFVGFGSRLDIALDPGAHITVKPARFEFELVDIGLPVENISGTAAPHIDDPALEVSELSMEVLGGTVTAEPFRFDFDSDSNELMLKASGIQLPLMAGLADLEAVTISGSVSGDIPVTIRGNKVIIDGGRLENDPPGGVIRYRGGAAEGIVQEGSQLGVVTRTLQNFEFESLTSAVNYTEGGDLVLQMRLKGINPDVDPLQPVILNLKVENNIPQMLRSLQATRSIEDVLEKRLSK